MKQIQLNIIDLYFLLQNLFKTFSPTYCIIFVVYVLSQKYSNIFHFALNNNQKIKIKLPFDKNKVKNVFQ